MFVCLIGKRGSRCLGLGKHSVDLRRACNRVSDTELAGLRWAERDIGVLGKLRAGVK